ncbi:TatD family hydrolase [Kordiimonas sp. SCSIO 12603]|uniref:TatD family hydrolase n=1 Tax=Kordiimonas sp. SCSIO 12603 TaxID=2829596 RepID=UPI00210442C4|nr:TatD family hydrolase [Kordiimonas sp. SCSIO 12603]UTW57408.1 TatD family hydrolase [Kordiimonas sp. SCSIO 12603]
MSKYGYIVDSHCHLNYEGIIEQQDDVVQRARAAGVGCMLSINTKLRQYPEIIEIIEKYDDIFGTVGIHPHEAENEPDVAVQALLERAVHPKIVGIGETGLDYYYDNAPRDMQAVNFRSHITASRELGLPVIVHTRDADDDCINILTEEMKKGFFPGVIHCFTASQRLADACLEMGLYISISGIVTFRSAKELQSSAKTIPLNRLLIETDSPFLAPVPHRGKKCEPAFVANTAEFLADLRGESLEDLSEATTQNFFDLFSKITPPVKAAA